jgi:hypothetical protein
MSKSYYIFLLQLVSISTAFSQPELPRETITVHTNASFLLTGETLFFKVHCQSSDPATPDMSKVAYVELIDGDAKPVLQAKILLVKGEGSGDFFLTSKLNSDHYTMVAYTQWMKNFDYGSFFKREITIINPYRIQTQSNFVTGSTWAKVQNEDNQSGSISVKTEKDSYPTREKVTALISGNSEEVQGGITLSVRLAEHFPAAPATPRASRQETATSLNKYLPELRGKMLSGTIAGSDGKLLPNKVVFLSVPGKDYFFYAARSDAAGRFNFVLEFLPLPRHLTIQSERTDTPVIIKLDSDYLDQYEAFKPSVFKFDTSYNKIIEKRSVYSQIENSYYTLKKDSIMTLYPGRFYEKPDKSYLLDAYTRFPTMEDILREYVVEVIVRKRGEDYELKVMDGKTRLPFRGDPAILLDGIIVQDTRTIMDYDPKLLKKIEIVTRKYFLGPATFSGIVSLETFDGDALRLTLPAETKFDYDGLQPAKSYFKPPYNKQSGKLARIPDYRIQLAWVPNVKMIVGSSAVDFYTSDVPGMYEISIQGILKSTGPFKVTRLIRVGP